MSAPIDTYSENLHEDGSPVGSPLGPQEPVHARLLDQARAEAALKPNGSSSKGSSSGHLANGLAPTSPRNGYQASEKTATHATTGHVHRKPVDHAEDDALFRLYQ